MRPVVGLRGRYPVGQQLAVVRVAAWPRVFAVPAVAAEGTAPGVVRGELVLVAVRVVTLARVALVAGVRLAVVAGRVAAAGQADAAEGGEHASAVTPTACGQKSPNAVPRPAMRSEG
jgi:hypothetical protein